jgi:hypothetical protein
MIQAAGAHDALVVRLEIANYQVGSAVRAEAVLNPIGGAIEPRFALRNPKCFAPKSDIRVKKITSAFLAFSSVAIAALFWRLGCFVTHGTAQASSCDWQRIVCHFALLPWIRT